MHIAFLLPDLKGGGAQKMVINLANWFANNGHKCDLVVFNTSGIYQGLISPKVQIRNLDKKRSIHCIGTLIKYLEKEQPDVLFSALFHVNIIAVLSKLISKKRNIKLVISERNHITRYLQSCSFLKRFLWTRLIHYFYRFSDHIIGISNGVCSDLKTILPSNIHHRIETIYNPVVTDTFEHDLRKKVPDLFPSSCSTKLITSGRLVDQKDYPTLLKSFALYRRKDTDAHLVILGTGILEHELRQISINLKIQDHVTFAGFVTDPLPYMKQANIFIMTSAWEGFCNVIVEALYCGLSVVATDCPSGPAEILQNGQHGRLCPVGNSLTISEAIEESIKNPPSSEQQHTRALDFHVDVIGQKFLKRFEELQQ